MLYYPKIPGSKNCPSGKCIAFEKCDGTNLHWVWDKAEGLRDGWLSFGTRRDRFPVTPEGSADFESAHPEMKNLRDLFFTTAAEPLVKVFAEAYPSASRITCFTEYLGPNSFAGLHRAGDAMDLVLFDVQVDETIIGPEEFVKNFADLEDSRLKVARVVYQGKLTGRFAEDVRIGRYKVNEGVVCKGIKEPWMAKIKTYDYLEQLKKFDPKNWEQYWE